MLLIKSLESGRTLDITPGQEITLTLENPLFADDRMPVAVSTGIEFPLSPNYSPGNSSSTSSPTKRSNTHS